MLLFAGITLAGFIILVEGLRWTFRPEARRLRTIRKIGGPR